MFWPPTFNPNNVVKITDDKYVAEEEEDARFADYTQNATVLSPWMSWATIDTRWTTPNDAIMRILLQGEPPALLRSVNADGGHGAIIQLGADGLGIQKWEVVTYFDWYVDGTATKIGAYAWCRLWVGEAPEEPPPEDPLDVNESHGSEMSDTIGAGSWIVPAGVTKVAVLCIGAGGGGSSGGSAAFGGGAGGGGGASAFKVLDVTPLDTIGYNVGAGGGMASPGANGGDTYWSDGSEVLAEGGVGGEQLGVKVAGTGGQAFTSVGTTKFSGGNGGHGQAAPDLGAGGGGGAASDTQAGDDGDDGVGDTSGLGGNGSVGTLVLGGEGGGAGGAALAGNPGGGGSGGGGEELVNGNEGDGQNGWIGWWW